MGEINTKFVEHEYDYVKPASLDEALDILAEKKEKAKIYAGGTDLLVHLKMGKGGQTPHTLSRAFAFHTAVLETGDMHNAQLG